MVAFFEGRGGGTQTLRESDLLLIVYVHRVDNNLLRATAEQRN